MTKRNPSPSAMSITMSRDMTLVYLDTSHVINWIERGTQPECPNSVTSMLQVGQESVKDTR